MIRRPGLRIAPARLALVAIASIAVTGCTTFSDNDAVARFGDVELSSADLSERLSLVADPLDPTRSALGDDGRAPGDAARGVVSDWIRQQIVLGSDLADQYSADPASLGITCIDVAVATDQADADSIKGRLDGGEAWDDVVAPIEATFQYESKQPCQPLQSYAAQLGPEVADSLSTRKPGDAPEVLNAGQGGFAVVRIQEITDVDTFGFLSALQTTRPDDVLDLLAATSDADVYVDPRIGAFDPATANVVPVN